MNPPSDNEVATVVNRRHDDAIVSIIDYFVNGGKLLMSIVGLLTEALMCQENLVVPAKQESFKR